MRAHSQRKSVAFVIFTGLAWFCLATFAMAHASLTASYPPDGSLLQAAPDRLSLSFSEPVSPLVLKLVKPDGTAVALADFALRDRTLEIVPPETLPQGTFVLSWRVVSEDGHPVAGSVLFSVGAPSSAPPATDDVADPALTTALWLARIGLYVGLFFGIGGVFSSAWIVRERRIRAGLFLPWIAAGFVGTVLSAGLQGLDALGAPLARLPDPTFWKAGFETSFGRTVILMTLAFGLAGFATVCRFRRGLSALALVAGAAALASSGHASAAAPQWLTRPSVFLHVLAIAAWVGALIPLGLALRGGEDDGLIALRRFSRFIPGAVAVLVAAGLVLAVVQVQAPAALLSTAYGEVLLAKLGLLVPLFFLAGLNRWLLTEPVNAGNRKATRRLVRTIAAETLLVLSIFAVASVWRFTPPPRALAVAAMQPALSHIHTEKAMADITISPGHAGPVDASIVLMTGDFGSLDAKEVTLVLANPAAGIEPIRRKAFKPGDGTWRVEGLVLPLPGTWTLRLDVLISDFEMTRLKGEVTIRP